MEEVIGELLNKLTIEEKVALCSGKNFWYTENIERLGVQSIKLNDGPHGVRATESSDIIVTDNELSTCFPTSSSIACSWNTQLMEDIGNALGVESKVHGVDVLLGPGINVKRSPIGGRNFEYYSEDPVLTAELGKSFVNGVQYQGVGTSPKHFICNETEYERMTVDIEVSERALREIYLFPFERIVKGSNPWTVMASYNKVNGTPITENKKFLTKILKKEWSYDGVVVSDWGAVKNVVEASEAGMDLDMPRMGTYQDEELLRAIRANSLSVQNLDEKVSRILKLVLKSRTNTVKNEQIEPFNIKKHHDLAKKAADESIVLLKNDNATLPLQPEKVGSLAIIGKQAIKPRYQGGGSSKVSPTLLRCSLDVIKDQYSSSIEISFEEGYETDTTFIDEHKHGKAIELAKECDYVVLFVGTTELTETEGYDRKDIQLPENQLKLIEAIQDLNKKVVVVLSSGSAIEMPWLNGVQSVLYAGLSGQAMAESISDILFGVVNPSGKLAETFPRKLEDSPSYINYPSSNGQINYGEGVFVGYRYYEKKKIDPLFPFGHGLSYTDFHYENLIFSNNKMNERESIDVQLDISNKGLTRGKETIQLYIKDKQSNVVMPEKELKKFTKVQLDRGESKRIKFTIYPEDLYYYNTEKERWQTDNGVFEVLIGSSSKDIRVVDSFTFSYSDEYIDKQISEFNINTKGKEWLEYERSTEIFKKYLNEPLNSEIRDAILEMPLELFYRLFPNLITKEQIDGLLNEIKR